MSDTGVKEETLTHIGRRVSSAPPNAVDFVIHRGLQVGLGGRGGRWEGVEGRLEWGGENWLRGKYGKLLF